VRSESAAKDDSAMLSVEVCRMGRQEVNVSIFVAVTSGGQCRRWSNHVCTNEGAVNPSPPAE